MRRRRGAPHWEQRKQSGNDPYSSTHVHLRSTRPRSHFSLQIVKIDISPEPSEEERAAILAALAEEAEKPAPAPWEPEEPQSP
jgi:hypothetical protein